MKWIDYIFFDTVFFYVGLESQRVESTVPLDASEISVIPMILYPIRDITVYKGQEAYFECAVNKKPSISVKWFKGGEELTHKKRKYIFKVSYGEEITHKKWKYIFNVSYGEENIF